MRKPKLIQRGWKTRPGSLFVSIPEINCNAANVSAANEILLDELAYPCEKMGVSSEELEEYISDNGYQIALRDRSHDIVDFYGNRVFRYELIAERNKIKRKIRLNEIKRDESIKFCYIKKRGEYYGQNGGGYTSDINKAGLYERTDAVRQGRSCKDLDIIPIDTKAHNKRIDAVILALNKSRIVDEKPMIRVILESPYAGDIERNIRYARMAVRDSLVRGEAPIASHLLYTQDGILNDDVPKERQLGIDAGLAWKEVAEKHVFYVDYGYSRGMESAKKIAEDSGAIIEERWIL